MRLSENLTGVSHLGIPVVDVEKAVCFYEEKLNFEKVQHKVVIDPVDGALEVAFVRLGNLLLELYKPAGAEKEIAGRKDGIIDHYAIESKNVRLAEQELLARQLKYHSSTPDGIVDYEHVGRHGVRGVNFSGSQGEAIEICEEGLEKKFGSGRLTGWSHLALKVHNLEQSVSFYQSIGFVKTAEGYLDTPQGRLMIAFVECRQFVMEIIQVCGALLKELDGRGAGHLDHVALDVKNIGAAFDEVKKLGIPFVKPVIKELSLFEHGVKYFMITGPDHERIEFNQRNRW